MTSPRAPRSRPRARQGPRTAAGIALGVLLVVGVGLARIGGPGGFGGSPAPSCASPIAWDQAAAAVGERAAVAGPVVAAAYEPDVGGAPTFLNLGAAHPGTPRFDVVIYDEVRARFDRPPETVFDGRVVCVQGEVRDRDGVPQIVLDAPAFLTTHDEEDP